jgi:hypothetical protein
MRDQVSEEIANFIGYGRFRVGGLGLRRRWLGRDLRRIGRLLV